MPIITLQRQLRQLGRIRTGNQVATAGGRKRPAKLETFRLTSPSRELIEAAAEAYGGTVTPWANPGGGPEFEVITTVATLDIVVPPGQAVSQWYEMWSGGGCQRRCDGVTEVLSMQPCLCPADVEQRLEAAKDGKACKATTRLTLLLPALPDLGAWMLESHGYYAAVELAGAAEILAMASATGRLIPARLRLEQREKKVPGKPTNKYAVPVIEFVETRMADLQLTATSGAPQLGAGAPRPAVPALPETTLPSTSDFRAPTAPAAPQRPETSDPPTDTTADPPTQAAVSGGDVAASDEGLTNAGFQAALAEVLGTYAVRDRGAMAMTKAKEMWPEWQPADGPLSGAQRLELIEALRTERQEAALL